MSKSPADQARAAMEYLTTLIECGAEPDAALRMTCQWILAQGGSEIAAAIEKVQESEEEGDEWRG